MSQTDEYDPPPAEWADFDLDEWHLAAEPEGRAERMQFITVVRVNGQQADWNLRPDGDGRVLTVETPEKTAKLNLGPDELEVNGWAG